MEAYAERFDKDSEEWAITGMFCDTDDEKYLGGYSLIHIVVILMRGGACTCHLSPLVRYKVKYTV